MSVKSLKAVITRGIRNVPLVILASCPLSTRALGQDTSGVESSVVFWNMSGHDADIVLDGAYSCHSPGSNDSNNRSFCYFGSCSPSRPDGMHFCTSMSLPTGHHNIVVRTGTKTLSIGATQFYHPSVNDPDWGYFPAEYKLECRLSYLADQPQLSCGDESAHQQTGEVHRQTQPSARSNNSINQTSVVTATSQPSQPTASLLGEWKWSQSWIGRKSGKPFNHSITFQADGTIFNPLKGYIFATTGTWSQSGNHVSWTYSNGTKFDGVISGSGVTGTMIGPPNSGGQMHGTFELRRPGTSISSAP